VYILKVFVRKTLILVYFETIIRRLGE